MTVALQEDIVATVTADGASSWRFEAELAIDPGTHSVVVTATAADGTQVSRTVEVTRAADVTAPTIEQSFPVNGHDIRGTQAFLRYRVIDNAAVATVVAVDADGTEHALTEAGDDWYTGSSR